jgi:hypothetical protein
MPIRPVLAQLKAVFGSVLRYIFEKSKSHNDALKHSNPKVTCVLDLRLLKKTKAPIEKTKTELIKGGIA